MILDSKKVKMAALQQDLYQKQIAEKGQISITVVGKSYRNKNISFESAKAIANALGVKIPDLMRDAEKNELTDNPEQGEDK
ncbi:helix-turn-helix domain-containing protein [Faecalibaculum rodentium]|uniref:helix-turn-helix domain-containing protein n=1 Tax=Faecalibaculum rodentium TaxID=1702221 RepID=UPI0023F1BEAE|nr:helix-turn-helix transcriptional regulator [Faecalibaculum rodentium]